MEFKIGDVVKVISLNESEFYHGINDNMVIGDIFTIANVDDGTVTSTYGEVYESEDLILYADNEFNNDVEVNFIILPKSISLAFNGKLISISDDDARHDNILKAIKDDRLGDIPDLLDVSKPFKDVEGLELIDGVLYLNNSPMSDLVTDRVLKFKELGLPFDPLVKFSEKLVSNPSFNSRSMLYKFLEHNGHPITKEGNFIAYKKVRSNFKDCHTGSISNNIGDIVEMPRNEVDDNPTNTCSSGLHVASYNYASTFSSGHLLEVEINPVDVVAVPNDYNGEKMRVCKYKVVKLCESKLDSEIYDDDMFFDDEIYGDDDDMFFDD